MPEWATLIINWILGGGVLALIVRGVHWIIRWKRSSEPARLQQQQVHAAVAAADESLMAASRARQGLEADNDRLRREIIDTNVRHAEERERWKVERSEERAEFRAEIEQIEGQLRSTQDELQALKARHGLV